MRSIRAADDNLFAISARLFGDATFWIYLADLNNIVDPFIGEVRTLNCSPARDLKPGGILR